MKDPAASLSARLWRTSATATVFRFIFEGVCPAPDTPCAGAQGYADVASQLTEGNGRGANCIYTRRDHSLFERIHVGVPLFSAFKRFNKSQERLTKLPLSREPQEGGEFNIANARLHLAQSAALYPWRRKEAAGLLAEAVPVLGAQGSPAERKRQWLKAAWVAGRLRQIDEQSKYQDAAKLVPGSATYLDQRTDA